MNDSKNIYYQPCSKEWQQGDIAANIRPDSDNTLGVLITPQCDITWNKADYFLFILTSGFKNTIRRVIDPQNSLSGDHVDGITELSKRKLNLVIHNLVQNVSGNQLNRYYLLPKYQNFHDLPNYVDFQNVITVTRFEITNLERNRIVNISNPYIAQIVTRFSKYYSRIGTPDLSNTEIYDILKATGLKFNTNDLENILST